EPAGAVPAHVHSYEECFYVLDGRVVLDTTEGATLLQPGDYGLMPVGLAHAWRNESDQRARWVDMLAPQPRGRFADDTFLVPALAARTPVPVDVRDPRN